MAFGMVRSGAMELAIAAGSDAPFSFGHLISWECIRAVAPDACRPFCKDRKGMILGEGGAAIILEPMEAAQARGATIYGEIVGCGATSDAYQLTAPLAEEGARAMQICLEDAGITPEQVGYINAHGTGTVANDVSESVAIRSVFGSNPPAVSSTKSAHGHALGAAGALEAIATILALQSGILPPTINFTELDPACNLDVVANQARTQSIEYALSNSFAFGGLNAILAFRRWGG
jgi:nodulation protein E